MEVALVPDSLADIVGNRASVERLRAFAEAVKRGELGKPLLIHGPPGVGKSAAVNALAKEYRWNIVELSASDYRDKESLAKRLIPAANSRNLFGGRNVIILDEIDELAARFDSGAGSAIAELIKVSRSPIIFIANDPWDRRISFLRSHVEPVEFKRVDSDSIAALLGRTAKEKGITVKEEVIAAIAKRSNGDVRSALNDLSVFADCGEAQDELIAQIGMRDRKVDVFATLDKVFLSSTLAAPLNAMMGSDLDNDMLMKWIDENIPKRYMRNSEMRNAFRMLSKATIFYSRAQRLQYYGLWRYMNVMMSSGVALAKEERASTMQRYSFPTVVKSLSGSKSSRESLREVAAKLQRVMHSSLRYILEESMPLLSQMINQALKDERPEETYAFFASNYNLDKKEVDALSSMRAYANG